MEEHKGIKIFASSEELMEFLPMQSIKKLQVGEKDLCLARNKEGIYAFDNKCPHYSVPLDTGNLNFIGEVVCSLHAYRFNLQDGWETTGKQLCLKRYKVHVQEDGVFIEV